VTLDVPYIRCRLDEQGQVLVEVDDHELFDFIDDFLTEECGFDDATVVFPTAGSVVHTIRLPPRYSMSDVTIALTKLDIGEAKRIYALNNV
jgi:hypothetical protein